MAGVRTLLTVASLALLAGCKPRHSSSPQFPQTPVILISIDTLRADHLPTYEYGKIETPSIDTLRRDSILFENAYCQVPLTLPSHVTLLTGLLRPSTA
jgi:arylsulfatase A-like enzyme